MPLTARKLILALTFSLFFLCAGPAHAHIGYGGAQFLGSDTTTQGNWHGAYGVDGYSVANDSQILPSYGSLTLQNQLDYTWVSGTSDPRALQTGSGSGRIAATWYSGSTFSININFTDLPSHQVALYAVDWDNQGRSETIQILDAQLGTVLDTETLSNFSNGVYLVWNVYGQVTINVTQTGGPNAVIGGIFFGGGGTITSTATFLSSDTATEGNWHGAYGADGYSVANDSQSIPAYASFAVLNQANWTWAAGTGDPRALQTGSGLGRIAATWDSSSSFTLDVNLTDGNQHQIALYAIDWDSQGRSEIVQVLDAGTEAILDTENISGFTNGVYLVWNISGHVHINVIAASGPNAVVSGVFFGGSTAATSNATFISSDTTTQGNWHAAYGADGYSVASDSQTLPSYGSFAVENQLNYTWKSTTVDPRTLQTGNGSGRIAAAWYNPPSFSFDVNFTDGNAHQVALYAVDWDNLGRSETIQIQDAATEALLDTRTVSAFTNGVYFIWNISGHVTITVTGTAGPNAVVSGVFFGGATTVNSTAKFVLNDASTQGNWQGTYGADGYSLAAAAQSLPAYAALAVLNEASWTWDPNPTDPRALETGIGSARIAATWYNNPSFNFDLNLTDGNTHQVSLYAVDYDSQGRAETIQVLDSATEALLDTESLPAFTGGSYLIWNISGHVRINVIGTSGPNAVVSGLFFDPPTGGSSTPFLTSITVTPANPSVPIGNTQQFTATGTYSNGSTQNVTSAATWSSSAPTVATINSAGLETSVAQGSTTITTTFGGFSSFVTLNITPPVPVSIAISPQNASLPLGLTQQFYATGTYADGSTQDLTAAATWTSLNTAAATIGSGGLATSLSAGNTIITAIYGTTSASSLLTVTSPMLLFATVNPQNIFLPPGVAQQFTAVGTYSDGSTQDITALVTWGSSNTSVAAVSTNGLATAVSPGNTTILATLNGNAFSTGVTVTAPGPPTITASVSPSPNSAGWNNTNVTVTFTCAPGSAVIASCPGPQTVSNEGANQVISGTVTDSAGSTATATVTLNIDKTPPSLTVSSPADGNVFTTSDVTASGTVSDSLSGVSTLTCNGVLVSLAGASFSCDIPLNPGLNLVVVQANDVAGNVALTKMHVTLNVPLPPPNSLQITPASVNLVVGDTQQFTAIDDLGRPRTDATWTVSDTTIATITTDASPVVTAVAVGQVTLTATAQGVSTQIQLYIFGTSLAPGTPKWTVPPVPGSSAQGIAIALPSASNPDLYDYEGSAYPNPYSYPVIRAFSADGRQMWQQVPLSGPNADCPTMPGGLIPDGSGGLLALTCGGATLFDLDGSTGSPVWQYNSPTQITGADTALGGSMPVIRADGTVVAIEFGSPEESSYLITIDGSTGQKLSSVQMPSSTFTQWECGYQQSFTYPAGTVGPIVDESGNAYVLFLQFNDSDYDDCGDQGFTAAYSGSIYLLELAPDGSSSTRSLQSFTGSAALIYNPNVFPSYSGNSGGAFLSPVGLIPDGQQGVLAAWSDTLDGGGLTGASQPPPVTVADVSAQGVSMHQIPMTTLTSQGQGSYPMALGEGGVAFITDNGGYYNYNFNTPSLFAFNVNSGQILWTYPGSANDPISIIAATDDGVVINDTQRGIIQLDSNGNASQPMAGVIANSFTPYLVTNQPLTPSWSGQWYGLSASGSGLSNYPLPFVVDVADSWAEPGGNPSANGFSPTVETLYMRSFAPWEWFGPEPFPPCALDCFRGDDRSFTTSTASSVTSRITGTVTLLIPQMGIVGTPTAYSDPSRDVWGNTATGHPTISVTYTGTRGIHMEYAGSNPLVPGSPDINTKLDVTGQPQSSQFCYSGDVYGDAFPDSEVFVVNSQKQATMLLTFATAGDRNTGVALLIGDNNRDMGSFSGVCVSK